MYLPPDERPAAFATRAGFETMSWAGRLPADEEDAASGYLVVRRTGSTPVP